MTGFSSGISLAALPEPVIPANLTGPVRNDPKEPDAPPAGGSIK
jgi:hypothetical protein